MDLRTGPTRRTVLAGMLAISVAGPFALPARAQRLPVKRYSIADGLAHERVHSILADSRGFLWFCTGQGLSRFDGHTFTTYGPAQGLPGAVITDVLETSRGVYWVATNGGGVARFDDARATAARGPATEPAAAAGTASRRFSVVTVGERPETNRVNVLYEDRGGRLWAGTDGGVFLLADGSSDRARAVDLGLPSGPDRAVLVWAFAEDAEGSLWIGSSWGLTRRLPDGRTIHYAVGPVQGADHVRALLVDDRNRVWVGHLTGLIVFQPEPFGGSLASRTLQVMRSTPGRLPGKPGEAIRFGNGDGQAGASIRALHRSSDGRLWIASLDGVARYDGERFETISRGGGASAALSVAEDREGTIWIGTSAAGVARIARQGFTIFTDADGLGRGSIGDLIPDATGSLYVVSGGQYIHRLDGSRFATVRPKLSDQMTENVGLAVGLRDRTGDWWLPGDRGVYRFPAIARLDDLARIPPKAVYTTADGLAGEDVFRLFEDSRGDIWIGRRIPTSLVLTRWERATATFHRYSDAHGLPAFNRVQAFAEDRAGNVWIGFRNGGLARYRAGGFTVFAAADGAPAGVITSLHLDRQGRLWVGSAERGASRIDAPAEDRPRFVHYTTAQGLSSNSISCITDDALGRLYFGVPRGLDRLDADSGRVRHFATADGLAGGAPSAALRDRHGALWFATLQGLSRLIPEPDRQGSPPAIFIGGLRVAGETYPISDLGERDVDTGELRPHQNRLQIDFFGMSTSVDLSYQYKLEPPDREWSEPSDQRSVHYASLSPGAYRFLVRAVAAESLISSAPAAVSFTILPPIWQRWWFIALLGACGALAIHAVYRYRLVRALELERVRTRIATDLHDDVGANLSQIAILSEVARAQAGEREQAIDQPLSRIASLSRESVDAMSEIVWAIDPHHDRFNDLASRMRRLASEVFPPRGIALEFRTTGDPTVPVGAVARRELFLVFKEAINNIIRHAGATRVEVILRVDGRRLSLTVSDDGRGFRPITHGPGQGLRSMRRRAASLGGTLEVISQPGQGTRVTLAIPIRSHASRAAGAREASGVGPV